MSYSLQENHSKQSGTTLIEVLISMLLLAIGLLGLGGLQIASLKGANNSHSRNIATMYGMELADRMRSNPIGVAGGFYGNAISCTGGAACRRNTYCTPQQVAFFDVQEVTCGMKRASNREGGVKNSLTNGSLDVTCVAGCATAKAEHDIRITWGKAKTHQKLVDDEFTQTLVISVTP